MVDEQALGAVMLARRRPELERWLRETIECDPPAEHGEGYRQRFVLGRLNHAGFICVYTIDGYQTHAEQLAFVHAEFVISGFLQALANMNPPPSGCAFVDVGGEVTGDEIFGYDTVEDALQAFETDVEQVLAARERLLAGGTVVWSSEAD